MTEHSSHLQDVILDSSFSQSERQDAMDRLVLRSGGDGRWCILRILVERPDLFGLLGVDRHRERLCSGPDWVLRIVFLRAEAITNAGGSMKQALEALAGDVKFRKELEAGVDRDATHPGFSGAWVSARHHRRYYDDTWDLLARAPDLAALVPNAALGEMLDTSSVARPGVHGIGQGMTDAGVEVKPDNPFAPPVLYSRLKAHLRRLSASDALAFFTTYLIPELEDKVDAEMIGALANKCIRACKRSNSAIGWKVAEMMLVPNAPLRGRLGDKEGPLMAAAVLSMARWDSRHLAEFLGSHDGELPLPQATSVACERALQDLMAQNPSSEVRLSAMLAIGRTPNAASGGRRRTTSEPADGAAKDAAKGADKRAPVKMPMA